MKILSSPSPCFPLLSPHKPSFFSIKTLTPKVEFSETLRFPKCLTKMQHRTPLRSLRCSCSSSPSIDDEKPPSSRIFVKGSFPLLKLSVFFQV
ncbi:hypothetical protein M6B38_265345 [Iris pallida]|uniref:Uncharacterized protein n=1 Tax=Iris pallida TaxID=29817 RepID=A0AAX6IBC1_IRIPA|nr:hypothetical protein M6B38_203330 [Iris pallida]KAJ6850223.1 hypothetical protein M6B38_265345 [Iris pallida]